MTTLEHLRAVLTQAADHACTPARVDRARHRLTQRTGSHPAGRAPGVSRLGRAPGLG
jgi:hypothetical protein